LTLKLWPKTLSLLYRKTHTKLLIEHSRKIHIELQKNPQETPKRIFQKDPYRTPKNTHNSLEHSRTTHRKLQNKLRK